MNILPPEENRIAGQAFQHRQAEESRVAYDFDIAAHHGKRARWSVPVINGLQITMTDVMAERYAALAKRVHELAAPLSEEQFWQKPFSFGNSFGHLVLHLTGNLSYYIGAQIAATGYVRDREREFTEAKPPSKQEALAKFSAAVEMVVKTIQAQSETDWSLPYSAKGANAPSRFAIVLQCATHLDHHVGQMIWLAYAFGYK
jgi:uncharacterized damage-inducible protein DinB